MNLEKYMTRRETTCKENIYYLLKVLKLTFKGFALLNVNAKTHLKLRTNMKGQVYNKHFECIMHSNVML